MSLVKDETSFYDLEAIEELLELSERSVVENRAIDAERKTWTPLREVDLNIIPAERIEKRNARERNRVRVVNDQFDRLRRLVLTSDFCRRKIQSSRGGGEFAIAPGKKLSKLKVLRLAIDYIQFLSSTLHNNATYEV